MNIETIQSRAVDWLLTHSVNHGPEFHSPAIFKEAEQFAQDVDLLCMEIDRLKANLMQPLHVHEWESITPPNERPIFKCECGEYYSPPGPSDRTDY